MKNLLFIFSLSFIFLFSCSSSDDDNNNDNNSTDMLVGKWQVDKWQVFDTGTIIESNVNLEYDYTGDCETFKDFFLFNEDGLGIIGSADRNCIESFDNFTWNRLDDIILLTENGNTENIKIVKLTNNELIIYWPPDSEGQLDFAVWGCKKI